MRSEELNRDVKSKKISHPAATNQTSYSSRYNRRQRGQSGQATDWPNKKDTCSHYSGKNDQANNTLTIEVNATTIKKGRKVDKNLS